MTLQYPSIFPVGYAGDYTDFLKTKVDRSGAVRRISGTVSVPTGTVVNTIVGLFPFQAGFNIHSLRLWVPQLDTTSAGVTFESGIYYQDSTLSSATNNYIASGNTAAQSAAAFVIGNASGSLTFDATAQGWFVIKLTGATTNATASFIFNAAIDYDISGVTN